MVDAKRTAIASAKTRFPLTIVHAFEQWELATDGLVTMTHGGNECADYSGVRVAVEEKIRMLGGGPLTEAQKAQIRNLVETTGTMLNIASQDVALNEVIMVDPTGYTAEAWKSVKTSAELSKFLGFVDCIFGENTLGCTVSKRSELRTDPDYRTARVLSTDIFFNLKKLYTDLDDTTEEPVALDIPHEKIWNPSRDDVPVNRCIRKDRYNIVRDTSAVYDTLVHEAGHAIGIGDGRTSGYSRHHPTIPLSTVNYDDVVAAIVGYKPIEYNCSPYPFDILAIYALYQTSVPLR